MLNKKTVRDVQVGGKRVLVRCDFNVPLDKEDPTKITSDKRIVESLKTINYLINAGARVILCSHIGKTGQGKTLAPVAKRLSELLDKEVKLLPDITSEETKDAVMALNDGDVVLLENTRKYEEEEANDPEFARKLASLGEIFVNDAFGTAHRAHASTEGVTHYLPSVAGFLIEKELEALDGGINNPTRPLVAIVGGSKVSSKIAVLNSLLDKVDTLLIGGGMTYTFVKAQGGNIGQSIVEDDKLDVAREILAKAEEKNVKLILPVDTVAADDFNENANTIICAPNLAGTVVWNGPVGVFEMDKFAVGTNEVAKALAESQAITIIGGGDSAAAVEKAGLADAMSHISTGGGASLELMEGKKLPGIEALEDKDE